MRLDRGSSLHSPGLPYSHGNRWRLLVTRSFYPYRKKIAIYAPQARNPLLCRPILWLAGSLSRCPRVKLILSLL